MIHQLKTITFDLSEGIGHIELNQAPGNQMTSCFFQDFNDLIDELKDMHGLKAIIINGKGRHFSSGANIDELIENSNPPLENNSITNNDKWLEKSERNYRSFLFLEKLNIPVIAAIRGVCLGSAFELALSCHFRFCGEDAVFGLPESTYNLMPGLGGIRKTLTLCGQAKTLELILKGNTFNAEEAFNYQLVDKIVPKRQLIGFSIDFAHKIMNNYRKEIIPLYLKRNSINDPAHN